MSIITRSPSCAALATSSSRSPRRYAGSLPSEASAGLSGAIVAQLAFVWLREVCGAVLAGADVLLEAGALVRGERTLEIIRDELDELATAHRRERRRLLPAASEPHAEPAGGARYSSSASRTFDRPRWRSTR